ncbi:unnamed protein product [Ceratitis capitata]|uniref:(Mediterranean fruit fly) hypothetical protein n=1 Tax=Ceratitis capitata TaxID=7213 RepID=A0A811U793_CERCA|nr:unnamed protein product [Ceratitis capitata]
MHNSVPDKRIDKETKTSIESETQKRLKEQQIKRYFKSTPIHSAPLLSPSEARASMRKCP